MFLELFFVNDLFVCLDLLYKEQNVQKVQLFIASRERT